jgi:hypothetical protein
MQGMITPSRISARIGKKSPTGLSFLAVTQNKKHKFSPVPLKVANFSGSSVNPSQPRMLRWLLKLHLQPPFRLILANVEGMREHIAE